MRKLLVLIIGVLALAGCTGGSSDAAPKPFTAKVDFTHLESCGRPCYMPIYSKPRNLKGLSVTKGWPCDFYLKKTSTGFCSGKNSADPDSIRVVCQVRGESLTDDSGRSSAVWDKVIVPTKRLLGPTEIIATLAKAPGGSYAYASDLWLGNHGKRGIPCHSS